MHLGHSKVRYLQFKENVNQLNMFSNLLILEFDDNFNQLLPDTLPDSLTHLTISINYNKDFVLPSDIIIVRDI